MDTLDRRVKSEMKLGGGLPLPSRPERVERYGIEATTKKKILCAKRELVALEAHRRAQESQTLMAREGCGVSKSEKKKRSAVF